MRLLEFLLTGAVIVVVGVLLGLLLRELVDQALLEWERAFPGT